MLFGNFVVCKDKDSKAIYYENDNVYTGNWLVNRYRRHGMYTTIPSISYNEDYNYYTTHNKDILK